MFKRISVLMIVTLTMIMLPLAYAQNTEEETLRKGVDLTRHGKLDEAIAEFDKVIASNPKSANAYYDMGFTYDKKGDLAKAISNFGKAIELDPTLTDAYYNRGFAYYRKGAFENAINDYNKVIEMSPDSADAHYSLGLAYDKKGDQNTAISEYTKAIKARPNLALAYAARAAAYVAKKNYIGAMMDMNKAQSLGFRSRPPKRSAAGPANAATTANLPYNAAAQENPTQAIVLMTSGIIFLLVSILHLLRLIFRIKVTVGKFTLPVWFSAMGFIIPLILSLWIFKTLMY